MTQNTLTTVAMAVAAGTGARSAGGPAEQAGHRAPEEDGGAAPVPPEPARQGGQGAGPARRRPPRSRLAGGHSNNACQGVCVKMLCFVCVCLYVRSMIVWVCLFREGHPEQTLFYVWIFFLCVSVFVS